MKMLEHPKLDTQKCRIGNQEWSVQRLVDLSKGFEVFDAPLDCLFVYYKPDFISLREIAGWVKAVNDADLSYPIILDEDGEIFDGRHRLTKAIMLGHKTIKAVRFDENPSRCRLIEGGE